MLDSRKRFVVRIEEVDGKSFEYAEQARALLALAVCIPAFGLTVPAGTEIQIRLKTKVATAHLQGQGSRGSRGDRPRHGGGAVR